MNFIHEPVFQNLFKTPMNEFSVNPKYEISEQSLLTVIYIPIRPARRDYDEDE